VNGFRDFVVEYYYQDFEAPFWKPCEDMFNQIVERQYKLFEKQKTSNCYISPDRIVDVKAMTQTNTKTNNTRKILRVNYMWFWQSYKYWTPYTETTSKIIEKAYCTSQKGCKIFIEVNHQSYEIDFLKMWQCNSQNVLLQRNIIRIGSPLVEAIRSQIYHLPGDGESIPVNLKTYPWPVQDFNQQVLVLPNSQEWENLSYYLNSTILPDDKSRGNSGFVPRTKSLPKSFKILCAYQIRNQELWEAFAFKKEEIKRYHGGKKVKSIAEHFPVKDLILDDSVNEVYGFHGAKKETLDYIQKEGFNDRYGSEFVTRHPPSSAFGVGSYFSPYSSIANQYVSCPICNKCIQNLKECNHNPEEIEKKGGYTMLISRVLMGETYLCTKYIEALYKGKQKPPEKYDSILAVTEHKDMVVYDVKQIYCEYVVHYTRHL